MKKSVGERIFYCVNNLLLFLLAVVCVIPLLYIVASSFSSGWAVSYKHLLRCGCIRDDLIFAKQDSGRRREASAAESAKSVQDIIVDSRPIW